MDYGKKAYNRKHLSWRLWYDLDNIYLRDRYSEYDVQNYQYQYVEELYYGYKECNKLGISYIAPNPAKVNNLEYSIILEP